MRKVGFGPKGVNRNHEVTQLRILNYINLMSIEQVVHDQGISLGSALVLFQDAV